MLDVTGAGTLTLTAKQAEELAQAGNTAIGADDTLVVTVAEGDRLMSALSTIQPDKALITVTGAPDASFSVAKAALNTVTTVAAKGTGNIVFTEATIAAFEADLAKLQVEKGAVDVQAAADQDGEFLLTSKIGSFSGGSGDETVILDKTVTKIAWLDGGAGNDDTLTVKGAGVDISDVLGFHGFETIAFGADGGALTMTSLQLLFNHATVTVTGTEGKANSLTINGVADEMGIPGMGGPGTGGPGISGAFINLSALTVTNFADSDDAIIVNGTAKEDAITLKAGLGNVTVNGFGAADRFVVGAAMPGALKISIADTLADTQVATIDSAFKKVPTVAKGDAVIFKTADNNYLLVVDANNDGGYTAADDMAVALTGLTDAAVKALTIDMFAALPPFP